MITVIPGDSNLVKIERESLTLVLPVLLVTHPHWLKAVRITWWIGGMSHSFLQTMLGNKRPQFFEWGICSLAWLGGISYSPSNLPSDHQHYGQYYSAKERHPKGKRCVVVLALQCCGGAGGRCVAAASTTPWVSPLHSSSAFLLAMAASRRRLEVGAVP